jgi:chemotaxis protein MotB
MRGGRRRGGGETLNPWPGYVDALSTLLMVIIFVLLVFVLAQAFLSVALNGRDNALAKLSQQMAEVSDMLSLERGKSADLQLSISQLTRDLQSANAARDDLAQQLSALRTQSDTLATASAQAGAARDQLAAQLSDSQAQLNAANSRATALQSRLTSLLGSDDSNGQQAATLAGALAEARRQLAAMRAQMAEMDKTVTADKATIQARLADLAKLADQVQQLTALRDDLERQAQDAAARATTEQQRREATAAQLAQEQKFSDSAKAQIALLNRQVSELRSQLQQLSAALDASAAAAKDKDTQIANLGQRLNAALATKVEELQRYRSEFFGRLRDVLANRPGVQIVGDRFVFQSEVLFPVGSADMTNAGQDEINALATTLKQITAQIPPDLNWILRVDGHADHQPVTGGAFSSNWELSSERAINVVKRLIADGIAANHLAATGFADFQPLDNANTPDAYAKNRRIELRLTDR